MYYTVVYGINNTVMTLVTGLESLWGNMLAKKEMRRLNETFEFVEWGMHMGCSFLFVVTGILIVPFIKVYTYGINDANYIVPVFGALLVMAYGVQCLRVPYFRIIKAAGHYRQTQNGSIIQMVINIVLSLLLVSKYGLNGVAIGTFIAMLYHTTYFAWYLRKNILNRKFIIYLRYIAIDILCVVLCGFTSRIFSLNEISYMGWIILAIKNLVLCVGICIVINLIFFRKYLLYFFKHFCKKSMKNKMN